MIKIIVDADACPTIKIIDDIAKDFNIEVIHVCDTSHQINSLNKTITVDKGADSVDFKILSLIENETIIITQDYALASLCLTKKGVIVLHPNGFIINQINIETLLQTRYINSKARKAKVKTTNPKKRTTEDDDNFEKLLINTIKEGCIH